MPSVYVRCSRCRATFDGGDGKRGIHWGSRDELVRLAKEAGWTGSFSYGHDSLPDDDLCPVCTAQREVK